VREKNKLDSHKKTSKLEKWAASNGQAPISQNATQNNQHNCQYQQFYKIIHEVG